MPQFLAKVEFTFESENQEAGGQELRRLSQATREAGFELRRGTVVPAPPEDDDPSGWTGYVPLVDDDG